ncbi:hypothetical protein [Nonomuraea sp. NPDC003201]
MHHIAGTAILMCDSTIPGHDEGRLDPGTLAWMHTTLDGQILTLATGHALLMAVWLLTWTTLIHQGAHLVRKARFKRALGKVTAVALVILGVRAAAT